MSIKVKTKWAAKLMKAKNFLLVVDDEAVVFVGNSNVDKFQDAVLATAQLTALRKFHRRVGQTIVQFSKDLDKKFGVKDKKGAKKIKVQSK